MTVTVNGKPTLLATGATVADLVTGIAGPATGVAVAVNGTVVPRNAWTARVLHPGDRVEVLTAVQGG